LFLPLCVLSPRTHALLLLYQGLILMEKHAYVINVSRPVTVSGQWRREEVLAGL
jgi:hypothetical protein